MGCSPHSTLLAQLSPQVLALLVAQREARGGSTVEIMGLPPTLNPVPHSGRIRQVPWAMDPARTSRFILGWRGRCCLLRSAGCCRPADTFPMCLPQLASEPHPLVRIEQGGIARRLGQSGPTKEQNRDPYQN